MARCKRRRQSLEHGLALEGDVPHELSCGCSISHFSLSSSVGVPSESINERKLIEAVSTVCSLWKGRRLTKFKRHQNKGREQSLKQAWRSRAMCLKSLHAAARTRISPSLLADRCRPVFPNKERKLTNKQNPDKYSNNQ